MKVKVISRNPDDYQRETKHDIFKAPRNYNVPEDPFRHQVEYTRALNAAKLDRVFAKPFLAAFDGHNDAVHILAKHPSRLSTVLSGARDGQVKVWHLSTRKCLMTTQAHNGQVTGTSIDNEAGDMFVTTGQDAQLKLWNIPVEIKGDLSEPAHSIPLAGVPHSVSHIAKSTDFVTSGEGISVWKVYR
ncbi:WD repeats and SOF1 domain-containing protein [Aphelenchoides avenae]|nr:WD repeats and SOF1 domain-containing protein [Aphelenchus avenae]